MTSGMLCSSGVVAKGEISSLAKTVITVRYELASTTTTVACMRMVSRSYVRIRHCGPSQGQIIVRRERKVKEASIASSSIDLPCAIQQ